MAHYISKAHEPQISIQYKLKDWRQWSKPQVEREIQITFKKNV